MDLTVKVKNFPSSGETVQSSELQQVPGGKGANQAVAVSKLGGKVSMFGMLGNDVFAEKLKRSLEKAEVNTEFIEKRETSSGIALITVDKNGENKIIISPGANGKINN